MEWTLCLFLSAGIFLAGIAGGLLRKKRDRGGLLKPVNFLIAGTFAAAVVMFLPIYSQVFPEGGTRYLNIPLLSIHNAIRLFIVDGEFTFVLDYLPKDGGWVAGAYAVLGAVLFVTAPVLTFGVVLSFMRNLSAYRRYLGAYWGEVYVFSELNSKSLALAESLKATDRQRVMVFTDVFEKNEETSYEMLERAGKLQAITFKKDIQNVRFRFHSKKSPLSFFVIGDNEQENIGQAMGLIREYNHRPNARLYVFSNRPESDLMLNARPRGELKVRRINHVRSLIHRIVYDTGNQIFFRAPEDRQIRAVVVGMGQHGAEMVKVLSWAGQMDGYTITIHGFDSDPQAPDRFIAQCPELMDSRHNGVQVPGEAQYTIQLHGGIDVTAQPFLETLKGLGSPTYVFVALGNDTANIRTAVQLRMFYTRMGYHPLIQAVLYDAQEKKALEEMKTSRGESYDIDFVGDINTSYSEKVIMDTEVERVALQRHLGYGGQEEDFWGNEYNYRSSVAAAIHRKLKLQCHMPGFEKPLAERTEEERWALRRLEHRRWNAYMRSEGYCYGPTRSDLAKTHPDLVPFDDLSEEEKRKDDDD